jgi:hypothetical protein
VSSHVVRPEEVRREQPPGTGEPFKVTFVHHGQRASVVIADIVAGGGVPTHIHREHDEVAHL